MGTGQGLHTVVGSGVESVYGTPVAISRRHAFLSETLARQNTILEPQGISGSLVGMRRTAGRVLSARMGAGDMTVEVAKQGMGRFFENMLGGASSIAQQGATAAWKQTHSFGTLAGKAMTVQKVIRDGAGAVIGSFLYHGCKVSEWELTVEVDSIPSLRLGLDAEDVEVGAATATILGLPEPTLSNFTFREGALTVGGGAIARVLACTLQGSNSLKTDSFFLGSTGLKAEPEVNDWRTVSGNLRAEFTNTADVYARFAADTPVALVLTFVGDIIASTFAEELKITVPAIHFTGETPQVSGPGIVEQPAPFDVSNNQVDPPVTFEYTSTDTAI